ncbi:MAG: hypothetical protein H7123_00015 [Thermoleophilia bacterium]|nr:hypothetical protein [Thermoleophilia bacterium]
MVNAKGVAPAEAHRMWQVARGFGGVPLGRPSEGKARRLVVETIIAVMLMMALRRTQVARRRRLISHLRHPPQAPAS